MKSLLFGQDSFKFSGPLWTATNCTFKLVFDLLCRRWSEAIKTRSIRKAFGMVIGSIVWKKEQQNFLLRANEEGNSIVVVVHFIAGIKITYILISKHYIENGLLRAKKLCIFYWTIFCNLLLWNLNRKEWMVWNIQITKLLHFFVLHTKSKPLFIYIPILNVFLDCYGNCNTYYITSKSR